MRIYTIGGQAVTVQRNSLNISDRLNERRTCSFVVVEPDFEITRGMDVIVQQDGATIFAGKVAKPRSTGDKVKLVNVSCVGYSAMVDKRIVAEAYDNTLAGDIVRDLIAKYFADEGITAGDIQDGPVIARAVFNYDAGDVALNYLCDVAGFCWEVDEVKRLNLFDRATYQAPFGLSGASQNYRDLQAEENADSYRNRQIVRGPMGLSSVQTRTFRGDGETQAFTVDLPIAKTPVVKVNGVTQTVGIRNVDRDMQWYWNKGDKTISQDSAGTRLTAADVLTIEYQGFYPLIIVAESPDQIDARKAVEGGTGVYEQVTEVKNLDTQDAAQQYTMGLLDKYGYIPRVVTFSTYAPGLKSGQLIRIQNTKHNLDGTFLIESVTARDDNGLTLYSVKCLDGASLGGWDKFFRALVQGNKTFTIRENEILVKLITYRDAVRKPVVTDDMTYILHQYRICGQTICGPEVIL